MSLNCLNEHTRHTKVARVIFLKRLCVSSTGIRSLLSTGIINILIQDNTYKIKNWNVIQTHTIT